MDLRALVSSAVYYCVLSFDTLTHPQALNLKLIVVSVFGRLAFIGPLAVSLSSTW